MQNSGGKFLNIVYFIFLGDKEAEIRVTFPQFFEFRSNGSNIKFFVQFAATILESLIMQENYIRLGKLLAGFL